MASTDPTPVFDISVKKGTRLAKLIQVLSNGAVVALPVGTKAKMQIRTSFSSAIVKLELTTENNGITIDVNQAQVTFTLTSAQTALFDFERGEYDLNLIYPDNEAECIVEGKVYVIPSVTQ
jgi:hypothetical protein